MAYHIQDPRIGSQAIAETSTVAKHKLGEIVDAVDATLGGGEFIYLLGVANTVAGHVVTYDAAGYQTALASIAIGIGRPVAVAMSANVAGQYGWYQISGLASVKKASATSFAAAAALGATSGLAVAAASTIRLANAVVSAAAASGGISVNVLINRPAGPSSD